MSGFLTVKGKFKKYGNFFFVFPNLLIIVSILIVYLLKLKEYYLIAGYIVSYGIFGMILLANLLKEKKILQKKINYKYILNLSTPMMISSAFLFISNWTDVFMLGAMVSESELGIYNVAFKLGTLALIVIATVNTVLSPRVSELYTQNKIDQIKIEVQKATRMITYIAFPLVFILIVFRKFILSFFGSEFVNGELALAIIALGMLINAMSGSVAVVLNMTKHQKHLRNFTLFSVLINIILNFFLIQKYGILGAAIASLISNVFLNGLGVIFIKQKLGFYTFFTLKKNG